MVGWDIAHHHGIRSDHRVIPYDDRSEEFGSRSNVNMTADNRCPSRFHRAQGHLLKDQAVGADASIRMYHDPIRVGQSQPTPDLAGHRNVCAGNGAPEAVPEHRQKPQGRKPPTACSPALVVTDAGEQAFAGAPFPGT